MIGDGEYRTAALTVLDDLVARMDEWGLVGQAELARGLREHPARPPTAAGSRPAVVARLEESLPGPEHDGEVRDVCAALRVLGPELSWTRTGAYVRNPPDEGFLDRYAHATILGPPGGGRVEPAAEEAALGVLLLGPGLRYPPHEHPADEVYLPLRSIFWLHARAGDHVIEPAGVLIHHHPWQPHGMRVGDRSALLVYLWTGDVRSPSSFCR